MSSGVQGREDEVIVDHRFGFPVWLGTKRRATYGRDFIDMNANSFRREVQSLLIHEPSPVTGSQLLFIRESMRLNQISFARGCEVAVSAVRRWEAEGNKVSGMDSQTECRVRDALAEMLESSPVLEPVGFVVSLTEV